MAHIEKRTVKVMKEVDEDRFMLEVNLEEAQVIKASLENFRTNDRELGLIATKLSIALNGHGVAYSDNLTINSNGVWNKK